MDNQEHTNSNYNRLIVLRLYTCVSNYNTKRSVNITKVRAFFERSTIVLRLPYVNFLLARTISDSFHGGTFRVLVNFRARPASSWSRDSLS